MKHHQSCIVWLSDVCKLSLSFPAFSLNTATASSKSLGAGMQPVDSTVTGRQNNFENSAAEFWRCHIESSIPLFTYKWNDLWLYSEPLDLETVLNMRDTWYSFWVWMLLQPLKKDKYQLEVSTSYHLQHQTHPSDIILSTLLLHLLVKVLLGNLFEPPSTTWDDHILSFGKRR